MKKLLTLFAFTFLSIGITQAQENKVVSKLTTAMIQQLELDNDQEGKVTRIAFKLQSMSDKIQSSGLSKEKIESKKIVYQNRERMNMKTLLTQEQYKKYLKLTRRI